MSKNKPPGIAEYLLRTFTKRDDWFYILGDLSETYSQKVESNGKLVANAWYIGQIAKLFPKYLFNEIRTEKNMIKNYLKTAIRNLIRHKSQTLINISGLSISLSIFLMIALYVQFETGYDTFHKDYRNIYRVNMDRDTPTTLIKSGQLSLRPGPIMKKEFPEIKNMVRFYKSDNSLTTYKDKIIIENDFFFVDSTVFEVFDFEFIRGDKETAIKTPDSIILTEETAKRYFGDEDPMGKVIFSTEQYWNVNKNYIVTGVLKDLPVNSHIQFDFLAPFFIFEKFTGLTSNPPNPRDDPGGLWGWNVYITFLQLNDNVLPEQLESKFSEFVRTYYPQQIRDSVTLSLFPLADIHVRSDRNNGFGGGSNINTIYVLSVLAFSVLLIACINFINLSTAKSLLRGKEVGVRKVMGATKRMLVTQYLIESNILSFCSVLLALLLANAMLPVFNSLVDKELTFSLFSIEFIVLLSVVTGLAVGFLSGLYPAFFLSVFQPISALKGTLTKGLKGTSFRRILVTFQFSVSILLIVSTLIIYDQLEYILEKDLGFEQDKLIYLEVPSGLTDQNPNKFVTFQQEVRNFSEVENITTTEARPGVRSAIYSVNVEGMPADEATSVPFMWVDDNFLETFDLELIHGKPEVFGGKNAQIHYYINESAAAMFGWEDDPLGKRIERRRSSRSNFLGRVSGVIRDFHFEPLYNNIKPLVIGVYPMLVSNGRWNVFVKVKAGNLRTAVENIENKWKEYYPQRPFSFSFLDETIGQQYEAQNDLMAILLYLAGFTIFIACLGLFGLSSFLTQKRTKEIGIRKVLGASSASISYLLSREFGVLVLLSNVIAWPAAYIFASGWLQGFAYRVDLNYFLFVVSAFSALLVALGTVSFQAIKSARSNPVKALRYE